MPGPTAARYLAALAKARKDDAVEPMLALLEILVGADQLQLLEDGIHDGRFPSTGCPDLLGEAVQHLSGRPLQAAIALSSAAVSQWSVIRGRLVRDGVPDPMRTLPTLWALLDSVEWMILESKKDDKDTAEYWRSLYPAQRQFSDEEEAASAEAFFGAFG